MNKKYTCNLNLKKNRCLLNKHSVKTRLLTTMSLKDPPLKKILNLAPDVGQIKTTDAPYQ